MSSNSGHKLERDTFVMICKGSISCVPRSLTEPANHLIYGIADGHHWHDRHTGVNGGQETLLFLTRGTWLAKRVGIIKRLTRSEMIPVSAGFPFGVMVGGINLPLPSKIVTQVLPAIDITARFGEEPDVAEVDSYIRKVMQKVLDKLAGQRRFPVLG